MRYTIIPKAPGGCARAGSHIARSMSRVEVMLRSMEIGASRLPGGSLSTRDLSEQSPCVEYIHGVLSQLSFTAPTIRIVFPPESPEAKSRQSEFARRLSWVPPHLAAFGFVRGRSCYKAAITHAAYWGFPQQGDVSYLKADMRNFFHSVTGDKVERALDAHRINWTSVEDLAECGGLIDWRDPSSGASNDGSMVDSIVRSTAGTATLAFCLSNLMNWVIILERLLEEESEESWRDLDSFVIQSLEGVRAPASDSTLRILSVLSIFSIPIHRGASGCAHFAAAFPITYLLGRNNNLEMNAEMREEVRNGFCSQIIPSSSDIMLFVNQCPIFSSIHRDRTSVESYMPRIIQQVRMIVKIARTLADTCCDSLSLPRAGPCSLFTPQGASTSPALSNLVAKPLDYRMKRLADDESLCYTRYADDMTVSWSGRRTAKEISLLKWRIARNMQHYGFVPNLRKFLMMGPGMRQKILGYAMNSGRPTIPGPKRKEILKEAERLVSLPVTHQSRSRDLQSLKRTAGLLAWCGEAHRSDSRITEAIAGVQVRMRELLSGGGTVSADIDLFLDHDPCDLPQWLGPDDPETQELQELQA